MRKLVTLTTDFGTRDAYVAQLKAVLYALGPSTLEVVDLTHEIAPQNVREAALFVQAAWPRFPEGTVHVCVVDPGVGSARQALALDTGRHRMLAPDNGVLSRLLTGREQVVVLEPARFCTEPIAATFHGRDVFAPAAALLAHGAPLLQLGAAATQLLRLACAEPSVRDGKLAGEIVHVDRFGNLITNLTRRAIAEFAAANGGETWRVWFRDALQLPCVRCYAEAVPGQPVALFDSSDRLELALRDGDARLQLSAALGEACSVELVRPAAAT